MSGSQRSSNYAGIILGEFADAGIRHGLAIVLLSGQVLLFLDEKDFRIAMVINHCFGTSEPVEMTLVLPFTS